MKFVSKNQNYMAVLKPGIQGNRLTGEAPVPCVSARFEDGMLELDDEAQADLIEAVRRHPGYGSDFIEVERSDLDPYSGSRRPSEPEHDLIDIEYGHIGKQRNPKAALNMSPDQKAAVSAMVMEAAKEMATEMAKEMTKELLPSMLEEALKSRADEGGQPAKESPADEGKAAKASSARRKAGRPRKSEESAEEGTEGDKPEKTSA